MLCKSEAMVEFAVCAADAWAAYRLCMLDECGVSIEEP